MDITLLLQWKTNLPLETDGKMWLPFKLSKQKRKEKRKCTGKKRKEKILGLFYIRKGPVSCLTIPCYMLRLETYAHSSPRS